MEQLGTIEYFKRNFLEWDNTVVPMNEPGNFLGKTNPTKRDMREAAMKTIDEYCTN